MLAGSVDKNVHVDHAQLAPSVIDAEMLAVRNGFRTPRAERDTTLLSMNSTGLNEGVPTIGVAYGFP